jgi:hypothetical protein
MINGDWWELFWVYGVNKDWRIVHGGMVYNERAFNVYFIVPCDIGHINIKRLLIN